MQQLTCKQCGNLVDVPNPRLELINQLTVSMIVWAHGEPVQCSCGNVLIGVIPNIPVDHINLSFMDMPSENLPEAAKIQPQKSRIIIPFGR